MTEEEKQIGLELQGYIDSIRDMTIKEIAIKHLKKYHLPKFLAGLLVKFSAPLLIAKDYELADLEKENAELKEMYHESDEDNNKLRENIPKLAEAKEIIKKFLLWENDWHNKTESKYELLKQSEQFLKGVKSRKSSDSS